MRIVRRRLKSSTVGSRCWPPTWHRRGMDGGDRLSECRRPRPRRVTGHNVGLDGTGSQTAGRHPPTGAPGHAARRTGHAGPPGRAGSARPAWDGAGVPDRLGPLLGLPPSTASAPSCAAAGCRVWPTSTVRPACRSVATSSLAIQVARRPPGTTEAGRRLPDRPADTGMLGRSSEAASPQASGCGHDRFEVTAADRSRRPAIVVPVPGETGASAAGAPALGSTRCADIAADGIAGRAGPHRQRRRVSIERLSSILGPSAAGSPDQTLSAADQRRKAAAVHRGRSCASGRTLAPYRFRRSITTSARAYRTLRRLLQSAPPAHRAWRTDHASAVVNNVRGDCSA